MDAKERIEQLIDAKKEIFHDCSDSIWDYAETRYDTKKSADKLCSVLSSEGFRIERPFKGIEHAFAASYGEGRPVIGLLAEYDALANLSQAAGLSRQECLVPGGNGHGCGHNALGSGALAAAVGIKDFMKESKIQGTVRLFGCPAEEGGAGKAFMAKYGAFDDLDAALTWHPGVTTSLYSTGMLDNLIIRFRFKGIAAHAAGAPERGRSALDAAELMNIGVNFLREHIIDPARIHYAFLDTGGTSPNVVQASAALLYYIRAPEMSQALEIYDRVVKIAQGAALMTETELEIKWDSAYSDYIANDTIGKVLYGNISRLMPFELSGEELMFEKALSDTVDEEGKGRLLKTLRESFPSSSEEEVREKAESPIIRDMLPFEARLRSGGSSDVGDVSWIVPTAQFHLAIEPAGTSSHSWQWVANGKSSVVHKGLVLAGKALAMTAYDLMTQPDTLEKAMEEHLRSLGGRRYKSVIPDDADPV